ncbi:MAG: metalloregulator ArsR/SmtB family transcription factor [bacterium]|nr:metalloregulator ArsR/SmtB family transcription factor [bacterium]
MPRENEIIEVSTAMKQLGDPSRLRIFWLLCHCEESVQTIASLVDMSSPAVSHHLRLLKAGNLIRCRRNGKEMYYTASDNEIAQALHHMIEQLGKITCPEE